MSFATARKTNVKSLKIVRRNKKQLIRLRANSRKVQAKKTVIKELSDLDRETMVLEHRERAGRIATSILRRWHAKIDKQELGSLVDFSLCEAARNFNPNKGAAFLTFLFYHVRGNLIRAVSSAVQNSQISYLEDLFVDHAQESEPVSIAASDIADALSGDNNMLPDESLYRKEMIEHTRQACNKLDPLAKEVVSRAFDGDEQLMDIAADVGYSRCHVSRVKRRSLAGIFEDLSQIRGDGLTLADFLGEQAPTPEPRRAIRRRSHKSRQVVDSDNAESAESPAGEMALAA